MVETFTYDEIDRTFFERLRLAIVAAGYLPDVTDYNSDSSYEAARAALRTSLGANGRLIEIFGVGTWDEHEEVSMCKMIVERDNGAPGSIGGFPATYYEKTSGNNETSVYSKSFYPDASKHITYGIRLIGDKTFYDRLMCQLVENTMHNRRSFKTIGDDGAETDKSITVVFAGDVNMSGRKYFERIFKYRVEDVFIEQGTLIASNIPALTSVHYFVYSQNTGEFLMSNQDGQYDSSYYDPSNYQTD